ncbi:hypothetical protein [Foetidibacter luteolus]|uniref:hypothetical protein n=1 Tax=Foetidibacter luteolus TaxID=2608880 RepID=UPI00129B1683|nr:hypothetical protein [Foetidibacter luteolus]
MSVAEMKEMIKLKVDTLSDDVFEKAFPKIVDAIENAENKKLDLGKFAPGIFEKYDELMKKLA